MLKSYPKNSPTTSSWCRNKPLPSLHCASPAKGCPPYGKLQRARSRFPPFCPMLSICFCPNLADSTVKEPAPRKKGPHTRGHESRRELSWQRPAGKGGRWLWFASLPYLLLFPAHKYNVYVHVFVYVYVYVYKTTLFSSMENYNQCRILVKES